MGAQDPTLLPRGSPAPMVAPEAHLEEPLSARDLHLKTKDLAPLLISYTGTQVQRGYKMGSELQYWPVAGPGLEFR